MNQAVKDFLPAQAGRAKVKSSGACLHAPEPWNDAVSYSLFLAALNSLPSYHLGK